MSKCTQSTDIKTHYFLRKRTAAALSWQRPLQLPAGAPHGHRVPAPPSGHSDSYSLGNIDTVPPWWTLTGTLSPCFFSFNHLHKCTQAPVSTHFISNQPFSKDLRLGHAGGRADKVSFLIHKKPNWSLQDFLLTLDPAVMTWLRYMNNSAPKKTLKTLKTPHNAHHST